MPKDWTDKIKNKSSAASEFLKPYAPEDAHEDKNDGTLEESAGTAGADPDFIDKLLVEGKKKKKDDLVLTGIYLQPDLAHILDSLGKKGGRGAKSRIVNEALRKVFTEKGLL